VVSGHTVAIRVTFGENTVMATVISETEVRYPTSDGRPMAETDIHRDQMIALIQMLDHFFADRSDVYVSGNLLMYYVPGDKRKHISPDVFVVFGVPKKKRLYYLTWEEGKNPFVVIEISSKSTKREDLKKKFELYRDILGVQEYFVFDPRGEYLEPRLQGFQLVNGEYVSMTMANGRMPSDILGLELDPEGTTLHLFDPKAGKRLLTPSERAELAEEHASLAVETNQQLEDENRRLRRELDNLRRQKNP
jgi:Uma2 family endonuclease